MTLSEAEQTLQRLILDNAPLAKVSDAYMRVVLLRSDNNKVRTADKLGIDRRTIQRKNKKWEQAA